VYMKYMPNNTLSHNDPKEFSFDVVIDPQSDAAYVGGRASLDNFVQENILTHLQDVTLDDQALAVVSFTIDKNGKARNVKISESTEQEDLDELILKAVCDMPDWQPAASADGTNIDQEFVLTLGNLESCKMNFFNTRRTGAFADRD